MSQPQETPTADPRRGGFATLAWVLVLFLVAYPLSTGPFFKLVELQVIHLNSMETVYAPLGWLSRNCKPVENFFAWYIGEVWGYGRG